VVTVYISSLPRHLPALACFVDDGEAVIRAADTDVRDAVTALAAIDGAAVIMLDRCEVDADRRLDAVRAQGAHNAVQVAGPAAPVEGGQPASFVPVRGRTDAPLFLLRKWPPDIGLGPTAGRTGHRDKGHPL
jgi:hypothetical protein